MNDMRRFLDIATSSVFVKTKKDNFLLSLLEGRSDQYKQMLNVLLPLGLHNPGIQNELAADLNKALLFKRDDRIIWAINCYRKAFVHKWASSFAQTQEAKEDPKVQAVLKKFGQPLPYNIARYQRDIGLIASHYLAIPYKLIQDYVFPANATPDQIAEQLHTLEEEFKLRKKGLVTQHDGDEIILKFPDGMMWMHLSRGGCSEEADAMGHCGNGVGRHGQSILSLRTLRKEMDGEKFYEPFLTFILESDGFLGEMKGKNNDKPIAKYHPAIIELLKLPIIKGLRGGGYEPENNFKLSDLSHEQQEALFEVKPELASFGYLVRKFGMTDETKQKFLSEWEPVYGRGTVKFEGDAIRYNVGSVSNLCAEYGNKKLKHYAGIVIDGDNDGSDYFYNADNEDAIQTVIDDLPACIQKALFNSIQNMKDDLEDDFDFEDASTRNMAGIIWEEDGELKQQLIRASETGSRYGAEAEMAKAVKEAIDDVKLKFGTMYVPDQWHDAEVSVDMTYDDASKALEMVAAGTEYGDLRDFFEERTDRYGDVAECEIKMHVPHYGFGDYDEAAAVEAFLEEFDGDWDKPRPGEFKLNTPEDICASIAKLIELGDGFLSRQRPVHPSMSMDELMRTFASIYKKYYGVEYKPVSAAA